LLARASSPTLCQPVSLNRLWATPDLPEVTTFGESEADVLKRAHAAIEEALAARIADGLEIPLPRKNTSRAFRLPSPSFLKVLLYLEAKHAGISRAEIARRLGWHRNSVDRLFQLNHASKLDQIEKALEPSSGRLSLRLRTRAKPEQAMAA
jgi:antitoxin HicB